MRIIAFALVLLAGPGCSPDNEVYGDGLVAGGFCVPETHRVYPPFWLGIKSSEYSEGFFVQVCSSNGGDCVSPSKITSAGLSKCEEHDWTWSRMPFDSYYVRLMTNGKIELTHDQASGLIVSRNLEDSPETFFISKIENGDHKVRQAQDLISHGALLAVCYRSRKYQPEFQCRRYAGIGELCLSYSFGSSSLPPPDIEHLDESLWRAFDGWKCSNRK